MKLANTLTIMALAEDAANDAVKFESLMILKHGKVLFEDWYDTAAPDKPHAMHSVSKYIFPALASLD